MSLGTYAVEGPCWDIALGSKKKMVVSLEDGYVFAQWPPVFSEWIASEFFEITNDYDLRGKIKRWMIGEGLKENEKFSWIVFTPGTTTVKVELFI
jgi:hypothetical protein